MMNEMQECWQNIPPIPWDPEDVWLDSCPTVTNYLFDAFEGAFGKRPVDSWYSRFPDGVWVRLQIDGKLEDRHNYWGVLVSSKLRRSGLDLAVVVGTNSINSQDEREYEEMLAEVRARRERRRSLQ